MSKAGILSKLKNILQTKTTEGGMPLNKGLPFIGTTLDIIAAGSSPKFHKYIDERHKESGPVFKENIGTDWATFVADPEIMRFIFSVEGKYPKHFLPKPWIIYNNIHKCKRGLLFMDGEEWYKHRKLLSKHFLKNELIKKLAPVHNVIVGDLIEHFSKFEGAVMENLEYEFYKHSISFAVGSLMGAEYIKKRKEFSSVISDLAKHFQLIFHTTSKLALLPAELAQKLKLSIWKEFETAVQKSLHGSKDMVNKIIEAHSPDGILKNLMEENLDFEDIVAIVADLMLAAGDTTAYTSQWALYLLAKNKNVQVELLRNADLIRGIVRETLRLYPPAIFISRYLPETVTFKGYTFRKDEMILLSMYTVGRNDEIYPNANEFLPQRWTRSSSKFKGVNNVLGYLPFAMGSRSCIGAKLALAQLCSTILQLVNNFDLTLQEEVNETLKLVPVPEQPIKIKVEARLDFK